MVKQERGSTKLSALKRKLNLLGIHNSWMHMFWSLLKDRYFCNTLKIIYSTQGVYPSMRTVFKPYGQDVNKIKVVFVGGVLNKEKNLNFGYPLATNGEFTPVLLKICRDIISLTGLSTRYVMNNFDTTFSKWRDQGIMWLHVSPTRTEKTLHFPIWRTSGLMEATIDHIFSKRGRDVIFVLIGVKEVSYYSHLKSKGFKVLTYPDIYTIQSSSFNIFREVDKNYKSMFNKEIKWV